MTQPFCEAPPKSMYCLGCDYSLAGLPENRCPECGREFDPADPATFTLTRRWRPTSYVLRPGLLVLATIAGIGMGVALTSIMVKGATGLFLLLVPLSVAVCTGILAAAVRFKLVELLISLATLQVMIIVFFALIGPDPLSVLLAGPFLFAPMLLGSWLGRALAN